MPVSPCISLSVSEQDELKSLVWQVLRDAVTQQKFIMPAPPKSTALHQLAASFVTLYQQDTLKGCIGSCTAHLPLWQDVCQHSYSSAFEDRRFPALKKQELSALSFNISILSELIAVENNGEQALIEQLVAGVDGLLLIEHHRSAVFLPSVWRALPDPKDFLRALKLKGGWREDYWHMNIELYIFQTVVVQ